MAQVFETSNNDTFNTATQLGNIRNSPFVRGSLLAGDNFDFFKFQVDRPIKGGVGLVSQGVDADFTLFDSKTQIVRSSANRGTTAADGISFDNLPTGEYTLFVSKAGGVGSGNYTLSANGTAITRAQMSVTVDRLKALERFDLPVPFTKFGEADFYIDSFLDGTGLTSRVFGNDDDISPNFTLSKSVDINKSVINGGGFFVQEEDPDFDDRVDINPGSQGTLGFVFDAIKGEVQPRSANEFATKREGEIITVEGNGVPDSKARISFHINYDTFTSSTSSFSNSTPVIRGTNASQDLTGQNLGGILCGEGGNDNLSGMGGNDVLCGGTGNDKLNGGTGKDISFGGAGRDTHTGGAGNDTFVLTLNSGVDVIKDFQKGKDKLGLAIELNPEILDIVQQGKNTMIGVGDQRLAILSNMKANQLNAADFATVEFTQFKGMEVPTLVA